MRNICLCLLLVALAVPASLRGEDQPAPPDAEKPMEAAPVDKSTVPAGKRTQAGLYATAKEAFARQQAAPDSVTLLDVRTPEEFIFVGHAPGAINVPLLVVAYEGEGEQRKLTMQPNPDFEKQIKKYLKPGKSVYVMCRSGGRSAKAADVLAKVGFAQAISIVDGFEGDTGKSGKRDVNGWKNSDLPWSYAVEPGTMALPAKKD